jgi:hypothetical protein
MRISYAAFILLIAVLVGFISPACGAVVSLGSSSFAAKAGVGLVDDAARLPVGRLGNPMQVPGPQNIRTTISGREFSGHALDQIQGRGFVPSVVENTIQQGTTFPTGAGTTGYFDWVNRVRVITDSASGRVVTVIPGAP